MRRITPLDIHQKRFPKRYRGYDCEDVTLYLQLLQEDLDELIRENTKLKEEARIIEDHLREGSNIEVALRDAVMKAQEFAEACEAGAREYDERVKREARAKSDEILYTSQQEVAKIHEDITKLKSIRKHFREEMRKLINADLDKLISKK